MLLQRLLLVQKLLLLPGESFPVNQLFKVGFEELLELYGDGSHPLPLLVDEQADGLGGILALLVQQAGHVFRPCRVKREGGEHNAKLPLQFLPPDEGLRASDLFRFSGATIVGMALLDLRRHGHAASPAPEKSCKRFRLPFGLHTVRPSFQNGLNSVEKLLGDDWLVPPLVADAVILEMAEVDRVAEQAADEFYVYAASALALPAGIRLCEKAVVCEKAPHVVERYISLRIYLKGPPDDRRKLRVLDDGLGQAVVQIPARGDGRVITVPRLLHKPALRVAGELVAVLLRLDEFVAEIRFSLRGVLEPKRAEAKVGELAGVEQVYDLPAVAAVSRQAVGVPGDDAACLAGLDPSQHLVELRPARRVRRFPFDDGVEDGEVLPPDKLGENIKLAFDRKRLLFVPLGGLAGVYEIFARIHARIIH